MAEAKWVRADLPFTEFGEETFVVEPREGMLHMLDGVGPFVWRELSRPRTLAEIVEGLCAEFDVDAARARRDAERFLKELSERRLAEKRP